MPSKPTKVQGTTAFLTGALSPNIFKYHLLPCSALGAIVAISFNKKIVAGTKFAGPPPAIMKPVHSIHSAKYCSRQYRGARRAASDVGG